MRSSLHAVRTSFMDAISALGYACYDRQRKVHDYPYIVIGEQTEIQNGDQGEFGQIATINIEVYNSWASDYGERYTTDDMVNAVLSAVITKPYSISIPGFDMPSLVLDNTMSSTEQSQTHTIHITVLRFRMQLFENDLIYITDEAGNYITDDSGNLIIE